MPWCVLTYPVMSGLPERVWPGCQSRLRTESKAAPPTLAAGAALASAAPPAKASARMLPAILVLARCKSTPLRSGEEAKGFPGKELPSAARQSERFGQHAQGWTYGQRDKGPAPAHGAHHGRDEPDGDHGQREADAGLRRERGAHIGRGRELRDGGRELRRVRDDGDAPEHGQPEGERGRAAEGESDHGGAESRERHGRYGQRGASPAVGEGAARIGAQSSAHSHRGEGGRGRGQAEIAAAPARLEAGGEKKPEPGPHGIELPHVA